MDGLEEISRYGMRDYFRDEFNTIDELGTEGRVLGGWDIHNKQYVVSTQKNVTLSSSYYNTLSFDEGPKGWTSFFSYKPDQMFSVRNKFYTLKDGKLWRHYSDSVNRGNFYGTDNNTSITFIFNPKISVSKNFQTINYEGSNGWKVSSFISDSTGKNQFNNGSYTNSQDTTNEVKSYYGGEYVINPADNQPVVRADYNSVLGTYSPALIKYYAGFNRKENKYFAQLKNNSTIRESEILNGRAMSGIKGFFATVTISTDSVTDVGGAKELFAVSANYVESSY